MDNQLFETVLPVAELLIIKRDVDLLKKMATANPNSIFMLNIMPYVAMVCYEAVEHMNSMGESIEISQKSRFSIKDVRNKAKFFDLKFNQIMQSTINVDKLQHRSFIQQMKYPELAKWNIHDNLGIYFDSSKKVLGNTQYPVWVFQDSDTIKKPLSTMEGFDIQNSDSRDFGYDLGALIGMLSNSLASVNDFMTNDIDFRDFKYHANDFNTNRCETVNVEGYKTIRLLLVHILSSIGFVLYGAKKCIIRENGLLLKIEYIILHYALKRLDEIKKFLADKADFSDIKLLDCVSRFDFANNQVLDIEFGKCMRHYGLRDKDGNSLIAFDNLDLALPLCGLVETRFNVAYEEYKMSVEKELEKIYDSLHEYMGFDSTLSLRRDKLLKTNALL